MNNLIFKTLVFYFFSSLFAFSYAKCGIFFDDGTYCDDVISLYYRGMVKGYPNGDYGFSKNINRAEFTKLVVLSSQPKNIDLSGYKESCFSDIKKEDWYSEYVCFAKKNDIVKGKKDGLFHPGETINYAEAAKILIESLSLGDGNWKSGNTWYEKYVEYMNNLLGVETLASEEINRGFFAFMLNSSIKEAPPNYPLIKTQWDQYSVVIDDYGRMLPGCSAVAVGQLINYYFQQGYRSDWLEKMLEGITVYPRFTDLNGNLDTIPYTDLNFSTANSYPNGESVPVRDFLYILAAGLDSSFRSGRTSVQSYGNQEPYDWVRGWGGVNGWGAKVKSLLEDRFRFKRIITYRSINALSNEKNYIVNSIKNNRPVLIGLFSPEAGHMAVIDQYRFINGKLQVRINFGWGGTENSNWFDADKNINVIDNRFIFDNFIIMKNTVPINYP